MNTTININEFGSVIVGLLLVGAIFKNAFPSFPNRFIPLMTWVLGVISYLALTNGWTNPQQWLAAVIAAASATGIHSGIKNTMEKEDAAPPPSGGADKLPLLLIGALLIGCTPVVSGCKSTPAKVAVNVSDSARITVEAALGAWDSYIVANHPPLKQQEAVRSAWFTYKQAQLALLDAAIFIKQAETAGMDTGGAQSALSLALVDASNALADMIQLLRQFGVKL